MGGGELNRMMQVIVWLSCQLVLTASEVASNVAK